MEANDVTAFFHGHDHQYAYEKYNDMVYTSVPSGSFTGSFNMYTTGGNSGNTIYADSTQGAGHLKVTVSPAQTTVEFIRYNASTAVHSYTMEPNGTPTYNLTVNAGTGGTISAPPVSPSTHAAAEVVNLTAVPNTGYHFVNWTGNVSTVANVNSASTTVTMNGDYTITANFTIDTHTLTYSVGAGGTITAPATSPTTHNYGSSVTITAVPNTGYHFVNWTGNVSTVANVNNASTTIVMNGNYSITANFAVTTAAPVAVADTYNAEKNLAMIIDAPGVLGNDTDANGDALTAVNASTPSHGALTLNANGSFTYTPVTGYTGDDTFTYQANDGALTSSAATVTIHVIDSAPPGVPSSFYGEIHITPSPVAGDYVEAYVTGRAELRGQDQPSPAAAPSPTPSMFPTIRQARPWWKVVCKTAWSPSRSMGKWSARAPGTPARAPAWTSHPPRKMFP